jgi:hypothetical protein
VLHCCRIEITEREKWQYSREIVRNLV